MFRKILILILAIQMAIPRFDLLADETKSFFDVGQRKVAPKLVPVPEVMSSSQQQEVTFEPFEQPAQAAADIEPMPVVQDIRQAVKIISVSDKLPDHYRATATIINSDSGCSFIVTAAHEVKKLAATDKIKFGTTEGVQIVAIDKENDVAVLEVPEQLGPGVELSNEQVVVGDKLTSVGWNGELGKEAQITTDNFTVKYVSGDGSGFYTDGPVVHGRSGAGIYKNGKLVGTYQGNVSSSAEFVRKAPELQFLVGMRTYTSASKIAPLLLPSKYPVTVYSYKDTDARTVDVTEDTFAAETANGIVLLDFWAEWCGPCKQMFPVLEKVKYAKIARINIDKCPNLAKRFKVESIPRYVLMRDGEVINDKMTGLQSLAVMQKLVDDNDPARMQLDLLNAKNDKRLDAVRVYEKAPEWVTKSLPPKYGPVVVVWGLGDNKYTWPQQSRLYSVDDIVDMCQQSGASKFTPLAMGGRWRQQEPTGPAGAISCMQYVDQLYGWYNDYLPMGSLGKMIWRRTGDRTFNFVGGKKPDISLENVCGHTGSIELKVTYDDGFTETSKLPVRDLKFGYDIVGDDVDFNFDNIKVHGLAKMVNGKLEALNASNEQSKGFVGILTFISILSYIHTAYVLFHPIMDIELPSEIVASTYRRDDAVIVINFEKDKQPFVKIRSLMTFNLGINQLVVDRLNKTAVSKFSGTIFAKQYTFHLK